MDTIRNYLDSMFAQLPNTPEVWRAKDELLQMMEDRYNDLVGEGKSENESVAAVIAEFGNLGEVAESLGIGNVVGRQNPQTELPEFTLQEAEEMIDDRTVTVFLRGLAVFFFIICPVGFILSEAFSLPFGFPGSGLLFMTVCIVAGIGLMVYSSVMDSKWKDFRQAAYRIDYQTASEVYEQKERFRVTRALLKAIGIILIIICFVPAALIDELRLPESLQDGLGGSMLFLFIAAGVLMLIYSSGKNRIYEDILKMNDRSTIAGSIVPQSEEEITYNNEKVATVMSVYWHTVTCIYLIWSFLTFQWWRTWIIWPVAAIIRSLINSAFGEKTRR